MEYQSEVQKAGRVTIPVDLRKKYNLQEGDTVVIAEDDNFLKIITRKQALDQARLLLKDASFSSDELVEWRRAEAQREQEQFQQSDKDS